MIGQVLVHQLVIMIHFVVNYLIVKELHVNVVLHVFLKIQLLNLNLLMILVINLMNVLVQMIVIKNFVNVKLNLQQICLIYLKLIQNL